MAHSASIILALIVNCCGIFIFRSQAKVQQAQWPSQTGKYLFDMASYFLLIDMKLYPKSYRRTHWIGRTLVEVILGKYLFETWQCDFWYPLENFAQCLVSKSVVLLRRYAPRNNVACTIICRITDVLLNKNFPEVMSCAIALFFCGIIMHGTRALDFSVLKCGGPAAFAQHVKHRTISGIKRIVRSFSGSSAKGGCMCSMKPMCRRTCRAENDHCRSKTRSPHTHPNISHFGSFKYDRHN